jgi:hypothetical protein
VPVHVAVGLTPAQARAYRIADNQTATLSTWDDDKLPLELAELQELGFDLNMTGFSGDELMRLLDSGTNAGQTDPDAVPEPPDEPITQLGDLWKLGKHRLLCGDSSKPEDVDRLLDGATFRSEPSSQGTLIPGCPLRVSSSWPLSASHTFTVPSQLPLTMRLLSALRHTLLTLLVWPLRVSNSWPLSASHTFTVWSALPLMMRLPSVLRHTLVLKQAKIPSPQGTYFLVNDDASSPSCPRTGS